MTVKELKESLEDVPDGYEVIVVGDDFALDVRGAGASGFKEEQFIIEL